MLECLNDIYLTNYIYYLTLIVLDTITIFRIKIEYCALYLSTIFYANALVKR